MVTINLAEYCGASHSRNVEILACKIAQHKDEKILLDLHVEGWDIVENGIEQVVKNICDEAVVLSFVNLFARPCDGEKKQKR